MFKALKDAKRRVVQTVYEKTTNAVEKTIDERTDRNFSNFCEMIDDMNECGAGYHTLTPTLLFPNICLSCSYTSFTTLNNGDCRSASILSRPEEDF